MVDDTPVRTETTARRKLRDLRDWATRAQHIEDTLEQLHAEPIMPLVPRSAESLAQEAAILERSMGTIRPLLLGLECSFVELQWRLPPWSRPKWLTRERTK